MDIERLVKKMKEHKLKLAYVRKTLKLQNLLEEDHKNMLMSAEGFLSYLEKEFSAMIDMAKRESLEEGGD
jgi:hypothetical protein